MAEYEVVDEDALWPDCVVSKARAKVQFGLSLDTDAKGKDFPYPTRRYCKMQIALEGLQTAIKSYRDQFL